MALMTASAVSSDSKEGESPIIGKIWEGVAHSCLLAAFNKKYVILV